MRKFFRQAWYCLVIMVLLPYVITVFLNGNGVMANATGTSPYVTVESDGKTRKLLLSEYAIGVLAREMDAGYEKEALKAQAVLIRTAIYKEIEENGSDVVLKTGYWTRKQMENNWGNQDYDKNYKKVKAAWEKTEGQVLMYQGILALTPYHKLSNGKTRAGNEVLQTESYPYLGIHECPLDVEAENAMSVSMIQGSDMEVTETDSAGYVTQVRCGTENVSGEMFRTTYHLPSASFSLEPYENMIRVVTRGIGHGMGMSQYTAEQMAKNGDNYKEILSFFFEGTALEEVAEILVNPE